jgi:hypothetical protein
MAKRNVPSANSIFAIGRALPPEPTNCPTSVAVPDRSTSSHDGIVCVPRCMTRSHRPSRPSDADRDCARVPEGPPAANNNRAPMRFIVFSSDQVRPMIALPRGGG